jgi:hypothetical protein
MLWVNRYRYNGWTAVRYSDSVAPAQRDKTRARSKNAQDWR